MVKPADSKVTIFMLPQQFPCGAGSSCCGPLGQSEEEIRRLKETLESEFACAVVVKNVADGQDMRDSLNVLRLVRSFGPISLPIIAVGPDNRVVSLGNPAPGEAVELLRPILGQGAPGGAA